MNLDRLGITCTAHQRQYKVCTRASHEYLSFFELGSACISFRPFEATSLRRTRCSTDFNLDSAAQSLIRSLVDKKCVPRISVEHGYAEFFLGRFFRSFPPNLLRPKCRRPFLHLAFVTDMQSLAHLLRCIPCRIHLAEKSIRLICNLWQSKVSDGRILCQAMVKTNQAFKDTLD